jgi:hypothetical protein
MINFDDWRYKMLLVSIVNTQIIKYYKWPVEV